MTNNIKKKVLIFLLIFIVGSFAGIVGYLNAKITTFEECENSWLPHSLTFYDYTNSQHEGPEKKCTLWTGKSFEKSTTQELTANQKIAVEIATLPLSYPTTIVEVKELECSGCFSVTLQRDDNQRQFTIILDDWKYNQTIHSK